ncbi:TPA: hypothetical protein N0F65_000726 [Lagenidium giganteum]|uniref:Uncharacterized protein n=1 Tax=Lagenidium giganteum TaxID=4803 RepID=A0AAV2ZC83_9STRA|nr:TPA: hypothetical protein N0F65_000726 [Lagenidium giganteum]
MLDNQHTIWSAQVVQSFDNVSATPCLYIDSANTLDRCYFDLPITGAGVLAGATCRVFNPLNFGRADPVGALFANCTFPNKTSLYLPNDQFATALWSLQTASPERECLEYLGEGIIFPCDKHVTMNGRVIHHRISHTEPSTWCREFGGYFIYDKDQGKQVVLIANVSMDGNEQSLVSLELDVARPVFNLYEITWCSSTIRIGGTASHISTFAFYGSTTAPWTARTSRSAKENSVVYDQQRQLYNVTTWHAADGDLTQIRTWLKDGLRVLVLLLIIYYRVSSIYLPLYLVYARQAQSLPAMMFRRGFGVVLHKRERRSVLMLGLLATEALLSCEDIVMLCQQIVNTDSKSYVTKILKFMSISRIVWLPALALLLISRGYHLMTRGNFLGPKAEDVFLLSCPAVWIYIPSYLYLQLFGLFSVIAVISTWIIGTLVQYIANGNSLMVCLYSGKWTSSHEDYAPNASSLAKVLTESNLGILTTEAEQITSVKLHNTHQTEALNVAAEGFICLVYGPHQGKSVAFHRDVTLESLMGYTARPGWLGVPDLQ